MADIKINVKETAACATKEKTVEITGADYINDELVKAIIDRLGGARHGCQCVTESTPAPESPEQATDTPEGKSDDPTFLNLRNIIHGAVTPEVLAAAIEDGCLRQVIQTYGEIDIILDTGKLATVVCAYVEDKKARFVFKDCIGEGQMNEEPTNKGGYYKSTGRKHVLEDIYPHLPKEWRDIIKPRTIVEEIDGERVEYADPLWLPSATDVFGPSENGYWKDLDDSFQLAIFRRERERVKECGEEGTYPWWLRSVYAASAGTFRSVGTGGSYYYGAAYYSLGFAPGFDI